MKRFFKANILVIVAVCAFAVFAAPAVQSQTIHAILVGDTVDPNIGRGDKLDLDLMKSLLRDASKYTGMRLRMKVFDDRIPRTDIMNTVKNLQPGSNDTVIFFYTGHGYRMRSFKSKWPAMALQGNSGRTGGLQLKWAYDVLKRKNPRLLIVMADACNNYVSEGAIDTITVQSGTPRPESYKKLFLHAKGHIIASSSIPGQYSYSGSTGSQYTVAFMESIKDQLSGSNPTWKRVMDNATRPIYGGKQRPQYAWNAKGGSAIANDDTSPPYKDEMYMDDDDEEEPASVSFGQLFVKMESHILYAAQTGSWKRLRPGWITNVLKAENNVTSMKRQILTFERHLLNNYKTSQWRSKRGAWIGKVRKARTKSQLVVPIVEVEQSLKKNAFITVWGRERSNWFKQIKAYYKGGGSSDDKVQPSGKSAFAKLLIELEGSVVNRGKSGQWRQLRNQWKINVKNAGTSVQRLSQLLIRFESNVLYSAQESNWCQLRPQWLSNVRSVSSFSSLSKLMEQFEKSIFYSAQINRWKQRRNGWLQQVRGL